jgi:hypothetical protein
MVRVRDDWSGRKAIVYAVYQTPLFRKPVNKFPPQKSKPLVLPDSEPW